MIRLIKVLTATALMMVLMATTVSPAFAIVGEGQGYIKAENGWGNLGGHGHPEHRTKKSITTGESGIGYACGQEDKKGEKLC
jgi:hypothetical protein